MTKCDAGCGEDAMVHLDHASYCDDCFSQMASDHLKEVMGWRPCGHLIYGAVGRAPAICLERHGTEHAHDDFFPAKEGSAK